MKMRNLWVFCAGLAIAGCGPNVVVEVRYDKPAKYEVAAKVKKLAIAEFGGKTKEDQTWGDVASDMLASKLDSYNKKFQRYELVDRKRLKAIMDERDLQIMISDASSATKAGKIANVDALIYGTVHVMVHDENLTRTVFDPLKKSSKSIPYLRRHCITSVNFTMDDVASTKTICTVTVTAPEYDSDAKTDSFTKLTGFGGSSVRATQEVLTEQVNHCVDEFLANVSPHEVAFKEQLEIGTTKAVENGNKLAQAGDYKEALDFYLSGARERPDDPAAIFNAGVMYEALAKADSANLAKAAEWYDKACKVKLDVKYVAARKRVRAEDASLSAPPARKAQASE